MALKCIEKEVVEHVSQMFCDLHGCSSMFLVLSTLLIS
jgi:hypothetical protein